MAASDRRLPYRVPLALGQARGRLRRIFISLNPSTFDQLHALCLSRNQPMSWVASDLIEEALRGLESRCMSGGNTQEEERDGQCQAG